MGRVYWFHVREGYTTYLQGLAVVQHEKQNT